MCSGGVRVDVTFFFLLLRKLNNYATLYAKKIFRSFGLLDFWGVKCGLLSSLCGWVDNMRPSFLSNNTAVSQRTERINACFHFDARFN